MERVIRFRDRLLNSPASAAGWRVSAALFCLAFLLLTAALLAARIHNFDLSSLLLGVTFPALFVVAFFLFKALSAVREREKQIAIVLDTTEASLQESEERFRQMADNIQEIFWMIDAVTRKTLYVNPAFETITGRSRSELIANPRSYEELFHPDDRVQVLLRLEEATRKGTFDERFRIVLPDQSTRWIWSRGFPVRDDQGQIRRLVGTALDITSQKSAEEAVVKNLQLAKDASAEAEAMREATLALTHDLKMDSVLDTLLRSLADLIPYETAQIFFVESDSRLFLARSVPNPANCCNEPTTIDATQFPLLFKALSNQTDIFILDTMQDRDWHLLPGMSATRSWLCVQLIASNRSLGILSLGHSEARRFTTEHQLLAKSLAIPAAAAIQNARLYECAKIYGAELEKRTSDLQDAQAALMRFQSGRRS